MEQLGHHQVGDLIVDFRSEEHHPRAEEAGVEVDGPLAARGVLDDGGDEQLDHW